MYADVVGDFHHSSHAAGQIQCLTPSEGWGHGGRPWIPRSGSLKAISTQPNWGQGPHHHVEAAVVWCRTRFARCE